MPSCSWADIKDDDLAPEQEMCGASVCCLVPSHQGDNPKSHARNFLRLQVGCELVPACHQCYCRFVNADVSKKQFKKLTRKAHAAGDRAVTKSTRRGRYVSYYHQHQVVIRQQAETHGFHISLSSWVSLCFTAAETFQAPIPSVLQCVMHQLMADLPLIASSGL